MSLGQGKLSVAFLHRDIDEDLSAFAEGEVDAQQLIDSNQLELMYDSQPLWDGATLAVGYKYLHADANDEQVERANHDYVDGQTAMVVLKQQIFDKGVNNTVIQYYGKGSALQGVTFGARTRSMARLKRVKVGHCVTTAPSRLPRIGMSAMR